MDIGVQRQAEERVKMVMIGCGAMARRHGVRISQQHDSTEISIVCEPDAQTYERFCNRIRGAGFEPPPNEPNLEKLLQSHAHKLDAAFIITPHALHHDHAKACLESGLDVLVEKPMVMNTREAESLIEICHQTQRLLVVSFNGSLSPQVRTAVKMLRSGELGQILNIHAVAWQDWKMFTAGTWRQDPVIAGGGFLFDTGAHMLNTVIDLAGEDFEEVIAWLDNRNTPVDVIGSVMVRLKSGALMTLSSCGDAIKSANSDVLVFCTKGILRTNIRGEYLLVQREGQDALEPIDIPASLGTWEQFLRVRRGEIENPCPPETGLRMARLWDAIRISAEQAGKSVSCE